MLYYRTFHIFKFYVLYTIKKYILIRILNEGKEKDWNRADLMTVCGESAMATRMR